MYETIWLKSIICWYPSNDFLPPVYLWYDLIFQAHFDAVAYTFDKHPPNHISFYTNVDKYPLDPSSPIQDPSKAKPFSTVVFKTKFGPTEQRLWPPHCVDGTKGFELYPDLYVSCIPFIVFCLIIYYLYIDRLPVVQFLVSLFLRRLTWNAL